MAIGAASHQAYPSLGIHRIANLIWSIMTPEIYYSFWASHRQDMQLLCDFLATAKGRLAQCANL